MIELEPRKSLYIGCGLTHAPQEFKDQVEATKDRLRDKYHILDFIGLTLGTNEDVYDWDINNCVAKCDMFVAVCDYPAIGLGWELREAVELGKPTLAVAHASSTVTRLVLGAPHFNPIMKIERYQNMIEDVPRLIDTRMPS